MGHLGHITFKPKMGVHSFSPVVLSVGAAVFHMGSLVCGGAVPVNKIIADRRALARWEQVHITEQLLHRNQYACCMTSLGYLEIVNSFF